MIMDCSKYVGKCVCGREHTLETKMVVVEYGATAKFEEYMEAVGLAGKRRAVVYDSNIYALTEGKHVKADQEIVLPGQGLRSEDILIEDMMKKLDNIEVIVAYGAGTIMDFGRYPAYKLGIPFVAIPTLASSDGFTADICSVIIEGQKKSIPMVAPVLVVADLDIIKGAPNRLVASGVNDILSKYISLVDWKISHIVDGLPGKAYTLLAYSKALKCKVRLVIWIMPNKKHKLFFATNTSLTGEEVLDYYRTRFQIEFCYRDAKQYCGLTHSQARDANKLDCAFNASFASLNVAKVMMKENGMDYSMSSFKLLMTNTLLTKRIFDVSRYRPNQTLINHIFKELFGGAA